MLLQKGKDIVKVNSPRCDTEKSSDEEVAVIELL